MGNIVGVCCAASEGSSVKIVYWEGNTKTITGRRRLLAGEIMNEFPESVVCDSDRFFIGHTIPGLALDDELQHGRTYFVLPLDIFSSEILSASSIAAFVASKHRSSTPGSILNECPLDYLKGSNGRVLIKVKPEFMERHITYRGGFGDQEHEVRITSGNGANSFLCSTPELRKEYESLVRPKDQTWSPNLGTISEANKIVRYSPYRFTRMVWEQEEDAFV